MKNISIRTLGTITITFITAFGLFLILSTWSTYRQSGESGEIWNWYEDISSPRSMALSAIVTDLGYGGVIHQFKNYILRQDRNRVAKLQVQIGGTLAAVEQYRSAAVSEKELAALDDIRGALLKYLAGLQVARRMMSMDQDISEIIEKTQVDDQPVIEGIMTLTEAIASENSGTQNRQTKAYIIARLRSAMGYGGMIHHFKDYVLVNDPAHVEGIQTSAALALEIVEDYRGSVISDEEIRALDNIEMIIGKYLDMAGEVTTYIADGYSPKRIDSQVGIDDKPALEGILTLVAAASQEARDSQNLLTEDLKWAQLLSLIGLIIAFAAILITGGLTGYVLRVRIVGPLNQLKDNMIDLVDGKLDVEIGGIENTDELGDMARCVQVFKENALEKAGIEIRGTQDRAKANLNLEIVRLAQSAGMLESVNHAALDLAVLGNLAAQVSQNGQTIAGAAEEMVASVDEISKNSEGAAQDAQETEATVNAGRNAAQKANASIESISEAVEGSAESLKELSEASHDIENILSVIEDIAEQTNLLALNATIEAARAGEAGKGFAVVASEVKGLANQTAKATEDISQRINALKSGMVNISQTLDRSKEAVESGLSSIGDTTSTMDQATAQVSSVTAKMQEITVILSQQKNASSEIAISIGGVAGLAEESKVKVTRISEMISKNNSEMVDSASVIFKSGTDRALCEMTKIDHVVFKKRVVDGVMGRIELHSSDIPDHHNCRLGKWYDSMENAEIKNLPTFKSLIERHKIVHASAKRALDANDGGDETAAMNALMEMDAAGLEVFATLNKLAEALRKGSEKATETEKAA